MTRLVILRDGSDEDRDAALDRAIPVSDAETIVESRGLDGPGCTPRPRDRAHPGPSLSPSSQN
jgi:hypothetical protein